MSDDTGQHSFKKESSPAPLVPRTELTEKEIDRLAVIWERLFDDYYSRHARREKPAANKGAGG